MVEMRTFGDFATFKYGKMPDKKKLSEHGRYPVYSGYRYVGYYDEYNTEANQLIIVARGVGGTGDVKLTKERCYLTNLSISAEIDQNVALPEFLYYYYLPRNLRYLDSGSAQSQITISDLEKVVIPLPPLREQKVICEYLSILDHKIAVNTEVNNNLLLQAQAIFSKFYDASNDKQSFTSLIRVLGGGTPKTGNPEYWNGTIPFFTPKDVSEPYTFHTEKNLTEAGLNNCNSRLYPTNTSFVTARGTVGKVSLAGKPMAMNQSCYALASETIDPILVYFYVLKAVSSLKHKASGAVFDAIVTRDFDTEVINILNSDDSKVVLEVVTPMMNAIHSNTEENIRLSSLRDALLPRLMSGELDVSEVEI